MGACALAKQHKPAKDVEVREGGMQGAAGEQGPGAERQIELGGKGRPLTGMETRLVACASSCRLYVRSKAAMHQCQSKIIALAQYCVSATAYATLAARLSLAGGAARGAADCRFEEALGLAQLVRPDNDSYILSPSTRFLDHP